jgi:hypothetical protein
MGRGAARLAVLLALSLAPPALGERFSIKEITYAEIEDFVPGVLEFETGAPVDGQLFSFPGLRIGERFAGQTLTKKQDDMLVWHDVLDQATPEAPLRPLPGAPGQGLAIRFDGNCGSGALHGLGPRAGTNLGTGTLALHFDPPVCYVAFRTAIDGMSRFGNVNNTILRGRAEGSLSLLFYDRDGRRLANFMRSYNPEGPIAIGYMQAGQADPQIAGVLLQNLDLGGIAIDDLRFDPECPQKLY